MPPGQPSNTETQTLAALNRPSNEVKFTADTAKQIAVLRLSIEALRKNPDPAERLAIEKQMAQLQVLIQSHIAQVQLLDTISADAKKELVGELEALHKELVGTRDTLSSFTSIPAAVDKIKYDFEQDAVRSTFLYGGVAMAAVAAVGAVIGFASNKWHTAIAGAAGVGIAAAGYFGWPHLSEWFQGIRKSQLDAAGAGAAAEVQKSIAQFEKETKERAGVTDAAVASYRSVANPGSASAPESIAKAIGFARSAIIIELRYVTNLEGLPAPLKKSLEDRIQTLNGIQKEISDFEKTHKQQLADEAKKIADEKAAAEALKTQKGIEEALLTHAPIREKAVTAFGAARDAAIADPLAASLAAACVKASESARKALETELKILQNLEIFPEKRRKELEAQRDTLTTLLSQISSEATEVQTKSKAAIEKQAAEKKKLEESETLEQQVIKIIRNLPSGNLMNGTTVNIAGINFRMGPGTSLYLNDQIVRIKGSQNGSWWRTVGIPEAHRSGDTIAGTGRVWLFPPMWTTFAVTFEPALIATAIERYQKGERFFENSLQQDGDTINIQVSIG